MVPRLPCITAILPLRFASKRAASQFNMAWRCTGSTNEELVENMFRNGLITDARVKAAFLKVDRAHYAPEMPYQDSPQSIGHYATISAPHMHASAIEHLLAYIIPSTNSYRTTDGLYGPRILDVGSGSGYLTHVLAELAGSQARVVGLEHIQALRDLGEHNMQKSVDGRNFLDTERVKFVLGDGRLGWKESDSQDSTQRKSAWDVIHVGAAAREVHPALIQQLKAPGCMFIPVNDDADGDSQYIWKISKDSNGNIERERLFGVRYVPLTDAPA